MSCGPMPAPEAIPAGEQLLMSRKDKFLDQHPIMRLERLQKVPFLFSLFSFLISAETSASNGLSLSPFFKFSSLIA